jgi:hypothetical protein
MMAEDDDDGTQSSARSSSLGPSLSQESHHHGRTVHLLGSIDSMEERVHCQQGSRGPLDEKIREQLKLGLSNK